MPTPNTNADGDFGLVSMAGQQGGADSGYANGNGSNPFTVDGASATSNYTGEARGRTRVPYVFGEQSIQEFEVTDNPYNAAYLGAGAGFVNTVTKSGTDSYHGLPNCQDVYALRLILMPGFLYSGMFPRKHI